MNEPTGVAADAATILFNLPDYRVVSTTDAAGRRQVIVETSQPPGCPSCGVISSRRKERRVLRLRDIPVGGPVEVLWSKYRWYCEESACERLSFFESTVQVPRRARSTGRLRDHVVDAVVQVVAIDPSAAFRKALRMWLPRTAVAVDHFHLVSLGNQAMTEARHNLSQQVKGRRGRVVDKACAHRMLLLRAGDTLSDKAAHRLAEVFAADDPTGKLQAVWKVNEQLRALLRTDSLADAAAAKEDLKVLVEDAARPETNKLYRTICRWWNEIEVLIVTGATTSKVEANNTGIKHIKRTARGYRNAGNYKSVILMRSAIRRAA